MTKVTLSDVSLNNPTSGAAIINANSDLIEAAFDNTLSRDGTSPNAMNADLDMNSNDILNLPAPTAPTNPIRLQEYQDILDAFDDLENQFNNLSAEVTGFYNDITALLQSIDVQAAIDAQAAAEAARDAAIIAKNAAELAETNAETAETNAEAAQTAAEAAESAASGYASSASSSASTATTQAGIATTQASNASASAVAAQSSEDDAAAYALDAAQSAAEAAASADSFDDVYLGSKPSDPTLDNDGNALVEGQLYWNNVSNNLRIYDGASWNAYSATAGITAVVDDTTPQLGGDLDVNGHDIPGFVKDTDIGSTVQAWDADLDTWATKTPPSGTVVGTTDTQTLSNKTIQDSLAITGAAGSSLNMTGTAVAHTFSESDAGADAKNWRVLAAGEQLLFQTRNDALSSANAFLTVTRSGDTANLATVTPELRNTTAGTNAASVVTVGGTQTLTNKTLTSPVINTPTVGTQELISGTSPALVLYESDGSSNAKYWRLIAEGGVLYLQTIDDAFSSTNQIWSFARSGLTPGVWTIGPPITLSQGVVATIDADGTQSSGTYTPDPTTGNFKTITNGGAFTLGVPSAICTMIVEMTNNGSAGAVTTSSYTKVNGDALTTVNGSKFMLYITKTTNYSLLTVQALQ